MTEEYKRGHIIVVMGPTGAGKGTLLRSTLALHPKLHLAVSCTTRSVRPGEVNGREYHFLSPEEFEAKVAAGEFLEWATFSGNRYGTLKSEVLDRVEHGEVVVLEIELQGVEQLRTLVPKEDLTVAYIESGGWEVLKERALSRAPMSEEELEMRYERYQVESASKPYADVIIDNLDGNPGHAAEQLDAVIKRIYKKVHAS